MDINTAAKLFNTVVMGFSPEFREKHLREIAVCLIGLVAVPSVTACIKYCVDKTTYRDCYVAAVNAGITPDIALGFSKAALIDLPTTT